MSELLPCPFCGVPPSSREILSSTEDETYSYWCIDCPACTGSSKANGRFCGVHIEDEGEAIAAWNARAPSAAHQRIAGLKGALIRAHAAIEYAVWWANNEKHPSQKQRDIFVGVVRQGIVKDATPSPDMVVKFDATKVMCGELTVKQCVESGKCGC